MSKPNQLKLSHKAAIKCSSAVAAMALTGVLALVSAFFLSADFASESYALDSAVGLESEVTATVDGTHWVSLTASDTTFAITPTNTATTDKQTVNVSVETNAVGGASLYLASTTNTNALYKDGNPANGNLPHIAASTATVESPTTLDNLATNTWAYSTDNTNYQGVPTNDSPNLIADINGTTTGTTSGGVTSATIPVYYAAKIDTSIPAGSYASSVTYSAVVDGGIVTSAELTSITVDGNQTTPPSAEFQAETENIILVTTNLKTNTYGTPRVYYTGTTSEGSAFYSECGNVIVGSNSDGYMTVTCTTTPTTEATGVTLHIVPKGEPTTGSAANGDLTGDPFCTDGTYDANTSECESGEWKWGSFTVTLPDITPAPKPLKELTYMQEMTTKGCAASNVGDTKQLIDQRDNKQYWVAKLADGNCWMTQNLDLDLDGRTLTPADSDVTSNWAPGNVMFTTVDGTGTTDYDAIQVWDLGDYVISDPDKTSTSYCTSYSDLSDCTSYFTSVAGKTAWTTDVNNGKAPAENVSYDDTNYDAHFLTGNYYSFEAATAGSAPSGSGDAPDSICPAGWQLPRYTNGSSSNADYRNLLVEYGLNSSNPDGALNTAPLYFVRSGYVYPNSHYLDDAGRNGYYWYGRANDSSYGNNLRFYSTNVNSVTNLRRYYGFSVRCIAPSA